MKISVEGFDIGSIVSLKDEQWIKYQRIAGNCAARTMSILKNQIDNKTELSMIELNKFAEDFIYEEGLIPTFKGYKGFPNGVCISVNKELVHGIAKDYRLKEGDIVSFDLGVTYNGAIADMARTFIFGKPNKKIHETLISSCQKSLKDAIEKIQVGKRLGIIGNCISKAAKANGFGLITSYGGHGLDYNKPHCDPFVCNKASSDSGIRFQKGMTIAIEPMFVIGSIETKISDDGWTVSCNDVSAHFEDTIYVHEDHVEVITKCQ